MEGWDAEDVAGAAPPPSLRAGKPRPQPSPIPEAAREQLWSSAWCT